MTPEQLVVHVLQILQQLARVESVIDFVREVNQMNADYIDSNSIPWNYKANKVMLLVS
jgi:uncharacterized protein VirK/YbjX